MRIGELIAKTALVALPVSLALGCTRLMEERPKAFPDTSLPRWDAPDYLMQTPHNPNRQPPGKLALDHEGRRLAFAIPGLPSAGLLVLDLSTNVAILFDDAIPSVEYVEPAFSSDGGRIAFLATPVPRFGWTEIWIATSGGRYEDRLPACNARHRAPVFSPDGEHIAYYRGLNETDSTQWRSPMWLEQRSNLTIMPYGIFELNLPDRTERQITELAYASPAWIEYAANDALLISAGSLLGRSGEDLSHAWIPARPGDTTTPLDSLPDSQTVVAQQNQQHFIRDIRAASPTISPAYRTGPPEEDPIVLGPAGHPVVVRTERIPGNPAAPARSFEHLLVFVGAEDTPPLFDTRTAPHFMQTSDQMVGVSGDLCVLAYWGMENGKLTISTRNRCESENRPDRTFIVDDLLARAAISQSPWRFGGACAAGRKS